MCGDNLKHIKDEIIPLMTPVLDSTNRRKAFNIGAESVTVDTMTITAIVMFANLMCSFNEKNRHIIVLTNINPVKVNTLKGT